jgi:Winged helix DNA-binding domain
MRSRLDAQLLATSPASSTEMVLERLLAVQAQDPRGARLAIRARSNLTESADVDDALSTRRGALVTWLNRGTLHLVRTEDYWWLHPLTTPQLWRANERRLRQEGLEPSDVDRGIDIVNEAVSTLGPQTRVDLKRLLDAAGIRTERQALVHLLYAASLRGRIVRGPMRAGQSAFVDVASWLGPPPAPLEPVEGLARLARRYLAGHGPASAGDLAKWAGVTLGQARSGLASIADHVVVRHDGLVDLAGRGAPARLPDPVLLGPFDPVLHGWADRTPLIGSHKGVVTTNGIFRATALVDGRVVGIWGLADGQIRLNFLERVGATNRHALERDGQALLSYLGLNGRRRGGASRGEGR